MSQQMFLKIWTWATSVLRGEQEEGREGRGERAKEAKDENTMIWFPLKLK